MIQVMREVLPELLQVATNMSSQFPRPELVEEGEYPRFRHKEHSNGLAAYLKAIRIVSALHAVVPLIERAYVQEANVIFRTIDEFLEDIVFLLAPQEGGGYSDAQVQFLDEFYQEEFDNPQSPLNSTQKRDRVPRKKVYAALGRTTAQFLNPSDGAEVHRTLSQAMSGYVHGAYPHIMDLYGGTPPRFYIDGMYGTPLHISLISTSRHYFYRGIAALLLLAQALQDKGAETILQALRRSFEEKASLKSHADAATLVRDMKKK